MGQSCVDFGTTNHQLIIPLLIIQRSTKEAQNFTFDRCIDVF